MAPGWNTQKEWPLKRSICAKLPCRVRPHNRPSTASCTRWSFRLGPTRTPCPTAGPAAVPLPAPCPGRSTVRRRRTAAAGADGGAGACDVGATAAATVAAVVVVVAGPRPTDRPWPTPRPLSGRDHDRRRRRRCNDPSSRRRCHWPSSSVWTWRRAAKLAPHRPSDLPTQPPTLTVATRKSGDYLPTTRLRAHGYLFKLTHCLNANRLVLGRSTIRAPDNSVRARNELSLESHANFF